MSIQSLIALFFVSWVTVSCASDSPPFTRVQYLCVDGYVGQCSIITGQYIRP